MNISIDRLAFLRIPGERYDLRACFLSRDAHFNCLDTFNDLEDNHYKCNATLQKWKQSCDPAEVRLHIEKRNGDKKDARLYTQKQLDDYNIRKEKQIRNFPMIKSPF